MHATVGFLAIAMWAMVPVAMGQQQPTKCNSRRQVHARTRATQHSRRSPASSPGTNAGGAAAKATPQSGTPILENPQPTGTLDTLPNQTLTPGATTVPSNAGGIAPASNDASSGEYTPSEGRTAPTTPGGNPSNTQGVPTFSSPAQPASANLPRTVNPSAQGNTPGARTRNPRRSKRNGQNEQPKPQ